MVEQKNRLKTHSERDIMESGNVLEADSAGHVDRLDAGHERKEEIKDGSCIYDLSLWAEGLAIY